MRDQSREYTQSPLEKWLSEHQINNFVFFLTNYQLVHIIAENACNPIDYGETQSCPWLRDRHKQRSCISYEFLGQISVLRWHKLVCARSIINPAHTNLCQWRMLLCANTKHFALRFNHNPSFEGRKRHKIRGSKDKKNHGRDGIKHK